MLRDWVHDHKYCEQRVNDANEQGYVERCWWWPDNKECNKAATHFIGYLETCDGCFQIITSEDLIPANCSFIVGKIFESYCGSLIHKNWTPEPDLVDGWF